MKIQMLKILLYLCCSIALGIGSETHYSLSGEDCSIHICDDDLKLEDDICFDILVHSMQFDSAEDGYDFDITLTGRPVEWLAADADSTTNGAASYLPLRAPPLVG